MAEKEILSPEQVAELLGVSLQTVRRRIADGTIPARKIGRLWKIRRIDIDRLLEPGPQPAGRRRR